MNKSHGRKGLETKRKIISISKQLFWENGYKKTTTKLISESSGINEGLITYYFSKKINIVHEIFRDLIDQIELIMDINPKREHTIFEYILASRIYYLTIFSNNHNSNFFKEILTSHEYSISYELVSNYYYGAYHSIPKYDDAMIPIYMSIDFGACKQLMVDYFNSKVDISFDQLISLLSTIYPRIIGIDEILITELEKEAIHKTSNTDLTSIYLLKQQEKK